jgi:hypothetical protein
VMKDFIKRVPMKHTVYLVSVPLRGVGDERDFEGWPLTRGCPVRFQSPCGE